MKNEYIPCTYLGNKSPALVLLITMHSGQKCLNPQDRDFGHYMDSFELIFPISTVPSDLSPSQITNFLLHHKIICD